MEKPVMFTPMKEIKLYAYMSVFINCYLYSHYSFKNFSFNFDFNAVKIFKTKFHISISLLH